MCRILAYPAPTSSIASLSPRTPQRLQRRRQRLVVHHDRMLRDLQQNPAQVHALQHRRQFTRGDQTPVRSMRSTAAYPTPLAWRSVIGSKDCDLSVESVIS
jgi:hypothetical protein